MGAPSSRVGMGATPYGEGTTFRVWAPDAAGVAVTGPFTRWPGTPLASRRRACGPQTFLARFPARLIRFC